MQGPIVRLALSMVGVPYRYGGSSPQEGFDCSGLVYYTYTSNGYVVPRTSQEQFDAAWKIPLEEAAEGDLVFFRDQEKLSHVGIYLGDGQFVHAPSSGKHVTVASITAQYYQEHLVAVGRLVAGGSEMATVSADMQRFAEQHAAAWSSQDPGRVAAHFTEGGSIIINGGTPSVGRAAVTEAARSFMSAYPDMVVTLERLERVGDSYRFHWHFVGTNTGPGGTGRKVVISGYEEWTMGADGLIVQSLGNYDAADWDRQLGLAELPNP